jgi:hypothetical protein
LEEFFRIPDRSQNACALQHFLHKHVAAHKTGCTGEEQRFHAGPYEAGSGGGLGGRTGSGGCWLVLLALDFILAHNGTGVGIRFGEFDEIGEHLSVAGLNLLGLLDEGLALFDEIAQIFFRFDQ